ncbi:uncharacterized protein BT62DRAFT_1061614 [Guyanagaster necrorhizus]|uniref:DUF6534 domain-containing protein n=1 Tax=Guyanagaster necrorhizus TaxID=856835 RepID=A0A9P8ATV4_9AGAR|nr:uncharacterized protein BT62DRAFT_1061614 [Guyanagaster necrorhizus MCA 3950]KAG7447828.1 hypothetical protein BT62DRAFT_1061614 [Guyanagaster necrorhizus MCA 3950]
MFIGLYINVILLGIIGTQMYMYLNTYRKDRLWMKIVVLCVANVASTLFFCIYLYASLILHFDPALTGIIGGMVQLFFAWRVKVLTDNPWLVTIVGAFALTGTGAAIATSFEVGKTPEFIQFQNFKAVVIIWLGAACLSDILISGILVWHLRKTGFQGTDELVDRIIRLTVQTGLTTSICAIIDLAVYLSDSTGMHLMFNFPLSKLYTNAMMSTLNSRRGWNFSDPESSSHTHSTSGILREPNKKVCFRTIKEQLARLIHIASRNTSFA